MAANVNKWSETPASNATADPAINWAEGQAPSTVNDSARQLMAAIAADRDDTRGALTFGGTSAALTLTTNAVNVTYQNGLRVSGKLASAFTAGATLNVDSVAAKNIYRYTGAGATQIQPSDGVTGQHVTFEYEAALNSAAGGWVFVGGEAAGRILNIQLLTVTGTYTKTAGANIGDLYLVGGGGAGGGAPTTGAGQTSVGGGGGSGAFTLKKGVVLPSSCSFTIGAGGTGVIGANGNAGGQTSFNATYTANGGGGGGIVGPASTVSLAGGGGAGGATATGDINSVGNLGIFGIITTSGSSGGAGGASVFMGWGRGGSGATLGASSAGIAGNVALSGGIFVVEYS